jgi:hypothetical protein
MAKDEDKVQARRDLGDESEDGKRRVIEFSDKSLEKALRMGRNDLLPDNVVIKSPYGSGGQNTFGQNQAEGPSGDDVNTAPTGGGGSTTRTT